MAKRIPLQHRGKRPQFFAGNGVDEVVSMILELTAETWVIKKRLYLLERVAARAGLDLTTGIEAYELSGMEVRDLDQLRRQLIATVLRAVEGEQVTHQQVREEIEVIGTGTVAGEPESKVA